MGSPSSDTQEITESDLADAVAALESLKAELGLRILLTAIQATELGTLLSADPQTAKRVSQFILREIVHAPNPQLEAEVMAIASGVLDSKGIQTRIAAKHGVSRAAVSKRVVAFADEWNLPPSGAMKSTASRLTFSMRNQPKL